MEEASIEYSMFLIFTGAAILATMALYARQAMIVGYILLGILLGPWGLSLIDDPELIKDISNIGIIFLLYLLGLDLLPQQLWQMLGEALKITLLSSLAFWIIGYGTGYLFGYPVLDSVLIGTVLMFSSTIIGLKLLPTTILHHRHTGQIIISVLLIQDLIAIVVLLLLQGYGKGNNLMLDILLQLVSLPILIAIAWLLERFILIKLIQKFDQIHEYIFLLAIAWCMGIAELATIMGLSHEIGAFIAGVTLASSPIALFITERLKPLRDFFLIIFFFSLGASFNIFTIGGIIIPALVLALLVIVLKPVIFSRLLNMAGEKINVSREVGYRLGQASEFSLLITVLAVQSGFIGEVTSNLIQLTTLLTFIISSYIIVLNYPTPIAVADNLRRD
ncbi:MAG: sodium:proton antiporter [Gammaproteobacteria bacterium RIFCSPLOWO2_02_47_7]|nr:MAG: sodium:proton antiporter [Gammaproteobacteria bacterium RIFCSPLOWO2_02_47_7]OGT66475.1 MAG: sodium:proton antiporter [Gammaproteobacteria bacterium RIFCSPLOWO2_01_FULL_47_190]OGT77063.1 MAG: sodium:proton antiporter [Gammaproteobacteria bacterium RIFCSPLOWO2_12_47_11]OGT84427.1 MAG: sodium:proton antiporter [Gammaproteobacteria bacterium RIFCSPLOWO2_12_FULL_47_76]